MAIYKASDRFVGAIDSGYAGIVFDCDGVLIDASESYDLTLEKCASAFASLLGMKIGRREFSEAVESLRENGNFNNDWDTLAVVVAYMYSRSEKREHLDSLPSLGPVSKQLTGFESEFFKSNSATQTVDWNDLINLTDNSNENSKRDDIIEKLLAGDSLSSRFYNAISYPKPVGDGLLATLFDEIVYGRSVFKQTYGFDCVTEKLSVPGLINRERTIVEDSTLSVLSRISDGKLGIITGRPRVPTIHTLGQICANWFTIPEICLFTGDYLLNVEEVKPSPKPMLKVASVLPKEKPIAYVGDSGEDLLLARNANPFLQDRVYFVGIASSKDKVEFFERHGGSVDCIVSNVNELAPLVRDGASWQNARTSSA